MAKRRAAGEGGVFETPKGSGRWRAFVSDGSSGAQKKKWVRGTSQAEVLAKQRKLRDRLAFGLDDVAYRLDAWLDKWLAGLSDISPTTRTLYRNLIDNHIVPRIGKIWLHKINPSAMQAFFASMERDRVGYRPRQQCRGNVLIAAFDSAMNDRLIQFNPARCVKRPKGRPREYRIFTHQELEKFLAAAHNNYLLFALFVRAATTGARMGELLALKKTDYDIEKGVLHIRQSLRNDAGDLTIAPCKTERSRRDVSLPPRAIEALRIHHDRLFAKGLRAIPWLFPNGHGGLLRKEFVARAFHDVLESAKLPRVRFYDLRHTQASLLLGSGVDVLAVSRRLGHASTKMTLDMYAHPTEMQEQRTQQILTAMYPA